MTDFPPPNERSDQLAPIGRRALAQVVDGLVVGIPLFLVTLAWGGDLTDANNDNLVALTALWLGVNLFYNTAMIATRGATIGKRLVRIKVVNRTDGSAVSWSYSAVRAHGQQRDDEHEPTERASVAQTRGEGRPAVHGHSPPHSSRSERG